MILVQSLLGSTQLPFYLECLKSLANMSVENLTFLFHTDGSISDQKKLSIKEEFYPYDVQITDPVTSKQKTSDYLKGFPNCQKMRNSSLWGIEFFDPLFANNEDPFSFYVDADILFLKPFTGLFDEKVLKGGGIFLRDTQWDAYSLRPWQLSTRSIGRGPSVVKGITTALVFWDKQAIDWDYLEWFLGATHLHKIPEWIFPTAQAGLADRCKAKTVLSEQITNLYPNAKITKDTFGVHLFGSYRKKWLKKLDHFHSDKNLESIPALTEFKPCERRGIISYSFRQIVRWKNTRLNLW
ncbi:MAG: hypothetical protein CMC93_01080 [Flavobacteriaceae bacterium]|nr:hypothetical protein [Flavobacteriaceae bacterium]|tara:strand:- start:156 stop:1043 length:888 start_codon:yes stop_codon:yes gene_type:complete